MMKKLIVLGILLTMVMAMGVVAQAAAPAWVVQIQATTDAASLLGQAYGSFGLRTKGSDSTGTNAPVVATDPEIDQTAIDATPVQARQNIDLLGTSNADLPNATTECDWFLTAVNQTAASGTMYVTTWNVSTANYAIPQALGYTITLYQVSSATATIANSTPLQSYVYTNGVTAPTSYGTYTGTGVGGTYNQWAFNNVAEGGSVYLELVAAPISAPITTPEPGSLVAMLSGLVGLVGYGIRRRK